MIAARLAQILAPVARCGKDGGACYAGGTTRRGNIVPYRSLALLVLAVLGATASAKAQMDPMEEQRCVWRCLSQSRGASDPAYDACVRAQCMGRPPRSSVAPSGGSAKDAPRATPVPAPAPRAGAWRAVTDLAYPAVAQCAPLPDRSSLCLVVSCPERGALALELFGLAPSHAGGPMRVTTTGAMFDLTLPPSASAAEGYRWPMPLGLAPALRTGSAASLEVIGRSFALSLAGSDAAIGGVEARCR